MENAYTELEVSILKKSKQMNVPINGLELEALVNVITKCIEVYSYNNINNLIEISLKSLKK